MSIVTLNINDFKVINPKLAKVVVSFTGRIPRDDFQSIVAKKLSYLGAAVPNSFRTIRGFNGELKGLAVGFIRANKSVRAFARNDSSKYRALNANVLMDSSDNSLWDVTEGSGGKYLTRQGNEDLTALLKASVYRRGDVPRVDNIEVVAAASGELVSFVDHAGDLDHGIAIGASSNGDRVQVFSVARKVPYTLDANTIISISPFKVDAKVAKEVKAASGDKKDMIDYYTKLYGYSSEYLAKVIKEINEMAIA